MKMNTIEQLRAKRQAGKHDPGCSGWEDCTCFHTTVTHEKYAALRAVAEAAKKAMAMRNGAQGRLATAYDELEVAVAELNTVKP